jgi:hypothetical protein
MTSDGIKERLAWLRMVFGVFALIDVSLCGYAVHNWGNAERIASETLAMLGVVLFSSLLVILTIAAWRLIELLKKQP